MKLLFVSIRRDIAGGEIVLHRLIERLHAHETLVVLPEGAFSRRLIQAGINVHLEQDLAHSARSEDPYFILKLAGRFPLLVNRLRRVIREFKADLVISNGLGPSVYAGPAARLAGVPNLAIHHAPVLQPGSKDAKRVFVLSKFCDGFIAVSDAMNRGLQNSGVPARKVQTIYNGLDVDFYKVTSERSNVLRTAFNLASEVKLIGLVATIAEIKGHHVVVEAARLLRDEFPVDVPWRVIFIGDVFENSRLGAEYKQRLQKQIESAGLQDKIIWGGRHANMQDVYRDLDIVLNASVEPEPLGTTIYEAMAMGRLSIASNLGGSSEIIGDEKSGFLVPAGDSRALAALLARILQGKIDVAPVLAAARQRVEEVFDIRNMVRRYSSHFESYAKKS